MGNNKQHRGLIIAGLLGTIIFGIHLSTSLFSTFFADTNIWWTPSRLALPLSETKDVFELSIAGKPLEQHLSEGTLIALDGSGGQYMVLARDISVRLNNWRKIQIQTLEGAVFSAFFFGVCLTLLLTGLYCRPGTKQTNDAAEAP